MSRLPGSQLNFTRKDNNFLVDGQRTVQGQDVTLAQAQTSSFYSAQPHWIPEGTVIVKDTASGKYYLSDDGVNGDRNAPASLQTVGFAATPGGDVVLVYKGGLTLTVTNTTGGGAVDDYVTDLNADDAFKSLFVADNNGGQLRIRTRAAGHEEWFYADAATSDGLGFAEGEANAVRGTTADYRVTAKLVSLKDISAADADASVSTLIAGRFKESLLQNATPEAKAALVANGSELL